MAEKKANGKVKLICLGICLIILILWGKRFIPMSKKEKIFQNECCAATILRYVWDCEMTHYYKSKNFFDFSDITKIKLSKKITLNIKNGAVTKYGYHCRVYLLPGERQEKSFVCYAWPIKYNETGIRSYAIDESGYLFLCSNDIQKYSGDKNLIAQRRFLLNRNTFSLAAMVAMEKFGFQEVVMFGTLFLNCKKKDDLPAIKVF